MGRKKRNSKVLEQAHERLSGLKSIDPNLDLGGDLSVTAHEQAVSSLHAKLDSYNQKLSELDEELLALETEEGKVNDLNGRMLAGVAARYGRDSAEYEKAGGVRSSDRKRGPRKAVLKPASQN